MFLIQAMLIAIGYTSFLEYKLSKGFRDESLSCPEPNFRKKDKDHQHLYPTRVSQMSLSRLLLIVKVLYKQPVATDLILFECPRFVLVKPTQIRALMAYLNCLLPPKNMQNTARFARIWALVSRVRSRCRPSD